MSSTISKTEFLGKYVSESSVERSNSSNKWKTMYKSSYDDLRSRSRNDVMSPKILSQNKTKNSDNLATNCSQNYREICSSGKGGIPIQQIANDSSIASGYRLINNAKCEWFGAGETNASWETMYQTQFPKSGSRFTVGTNASNSSAQYRLEQVFRHMKNRAPNSKL